MLTPIVGALVVALISKRRPEIAKLTAVLFALGTVVTFTFDPSRWGAA